MGYEEHFHHHKEDEILQKCNPKGGNDRHLRNITNTRTPTTL